MKQSLKDSIPFAEAFARLLHPFAEVVIHDISKDQIEAIWNPFSRREVGDPSYLDRIDFDENETVIGPYEKTNWDGRKLKSISTIIRNKNGKVEGFLCVNVDTSSFDMLSSTLQKFLGNQQMITDDAHKLFTDDLYEKINLYVQAYCREKQISLDALGRSDKKDLIHQLNSEGAFKEKNCASYIARVLGVSRATVYNYLKQG